MQEIHCEINVCGPLALYLRNIKTQFEMMLFYPAQRKGSSPVLLVVNKWPFCSQVIPRMSILSIRISSVGSRVCKRLAVSIS